MYARGMSQRDIAATVEAIYGFDISHEMISISLTLSFLNWKNGKPAPSKVLCLSIR